MTHKVTLAVHRRSARVNGMFGEIKEFNIEEKDPMKRMVAIERLRAADPLIIHGQEYPLVEERPREVLQVVEIHLARQSTGPKMDFISHPNEFQTR
jgi:hypothetical protein